MKAIMIRFVVVVSVLASTLGQGVALEKVITTTPALGITNLPTQGVARWHRAEHCRRR